MMSQKVKGLAWLVATVLFVCTFVQGLDFLARIFPWSIEKKLASFFQEFKNKKNCYETSTPESKKAFHKVLNRLYPLYEDDKNFPLEVSVLPLKEVNAFAYLGGKIFVYKGLIDKSESSEELAGILAHEIEHIKLRHVFRGVLTRLMSSELLKMVFSGGQIETHSFEFFLNMNFSLKQEQDADRGALQRLRDSRIDVNGFQNFFLRNQKTSSPLYDLLSDHPSDQDRARLADLYKGHKFEEILTKAEWLDLKNICSDSN